MVTTLDLTEFSAICRTCLSKENLLPMFLNISKHNDKKFLNTFFTITGLKVKKDDGLPQNICKNCTDLFNSIQNFRTTCKEAETKLLTMRDNIKDAIKKEAILPETTLYFMNEEFNISEQDSVKTEVEEQYKIYNFDNKIKNKPNVRHSNETVSKIIVDKKVKESKLYILDVTDSNQKRVICQLCQRRLLIKSFWTHMSRSHPGVDDRQVKCDLCNNYIMKEKMNRHKKLMHGNSFKCRYCKFEFKEKDTLVDHVASCPEKKKRKDYETSREMVVCDICSKTMQKGSLRVHKAIKHAGLGPVCDHCGKRFGNKLRLDEHYRAKHGYEKFKCSECEFQSASNISLRNHERRHRGEKPFVCETCGADFHAAYLLVQHRHSHRTDKRFKCDKCPASFKARNSLHTHTRACHTQTRVACSVCARAYSCRHYALKHMRAVHRYTGPVPPLHTHTAQAAINK